nr:hypothetical protein BaRGS_032644 [Batillaria attramentaria]
MQDKTTCLEATSAGTGLKINRKKTELMNINTTANTPVTVEKIRNEELWERAGQEPVAKQILRRKWGWKPASSTTRQAVTWNPQAFRGYETHVHF